MLLRHSGFGALAPLSGRLQRGTRHALADQALELGKTRLGIAEQPYLGSHVLADLVRETVQLKQSGAWRDGWLVWLGEDQLEHRCADDEQNVAIGQG